MSDSDNDDVLQPDEVIEPDSVFGDDGFGIDDLDDLAERAVEMVFGVLDRGKQLAKGVFVFAAATSVLAIVLGIAALSGGVRVVWVFLAVVFAVIAVGATLLTLFRLGLVKRGGDALVDEVRTLIGGDADSERTVIDTVESGADADDSGIVDMSKQFFSMRDAVKGHTSNFASLSLAMTSVTTFPGLMAIATLIGFAMLGFSAIFALILIF